jgi:hypothetical protein
MDYAEYISSFSFSVWQPDVGRPGDRRLVVPRRSGDDAKLIELPHAPVDVLNFVAPRGHESLYETLRPVCRMPRMSTCAVGSIINRAVASMPPGHCYVNVGTWVGFSLQAGMAGNPDKTCIGVDNFSEFGGPRKAFHERFDPLASEHHRFHEMDYRDYFEKVHSEPIGAYLYDGEHSYENQLRGLEIAEPYFGDECIVLVDDTNWHEPYEATYDFVASSEREYTVLLDQRTAGNAHPTFWNGMLVLRSRARKPSSPPPRGTPKPRIPLAKHYDPLPLDPAPLVSIVVHNRHADDERLAAAVAEARGQSWPNVEVVVADLRSGSQREAMAAAIDETNGDYVAFADASTELRREAVRLGVAFPSATEFNSTRGEPAYQRLERVLAMSEEVAEAVPAGRSFALANGNLPVPNIENGRSAVALAAPEDGAPVERLEDLEGSTRDFLVLGWNGFELLERHPLLRDDLESRGRRVLESDNAIVFDLRS